MEPVALGVAGLASCPTFSSTHSTEARSERTSTFASACPGRYFRGLQVARRPQDGPQGHHSGHRAGGGGGRTGSACRGVQGRDEHGAGARHRGPGRLRRPHASGRARRSAGETSVEVPPLSWPEQSHPSAVFPEFSPPLDPTTLTPSCPTNCVTRRLGIKSGPPVGDTRLEGGSK